VSGAIEVLKDNLKQVNKAYKNFGDYSSAGIVISKNLINALDEALLALEQKEKLKKHLWENYGYDEDIPVEEVLKLIGEVEK